MIMSGNSPFAVVRRTLTLPPGAPFKAVGQPFPKERSARGLVRSSDSSIWVALTKNPGTGMATSKLQRLVAPARRTAGGNTAAEVALDLPAGWDVSAVVPAGPGSA